MNQPDSLRCGIAGAILDTLNHLHFARVTGDSALYEAALHAAEDLATLFEQPDVARPAPSPNVFALLPRDAEPVR